MPGKISFIQHNITSLFPGKTPFQEGSFMKVNYILLISLLIVGALFVPAVSGEVLIDEHINSYEFTGGQSVNPSRGSSMSGSYTFNSLYIKEIQNLNDISYIVIEAPYMGDVSYNDWCDLPDGRHEMTYNIGEDVSGTGTIDVSRSRDFLGRVSNTRVTFYFDTFNIGTLTGNQVLTFSPSIDSIRRYNVAPFYPEGDSPIWINHFQLLQSPYKITVSSGRYILNDIYVESLNEYDIKMKITRVFGADTFASNVKVFNDAGILQYEDESAINVEEVFLKRDFSKLNLSTSYKSWEFSLSHASTDTNSQVNVYVQNSQTGALIADTNLNINLYGTETWYNSTLEWGWDTIQLPAGNYEFYAEKSGYTQYAPGRLTVDGVDDNINLLLYPDVAPPPAGNLTLQFWVCDSNSNGIPYAELSVIGLAGEGAYYDSGIIQTNNLGYATLIAPGNSTYTAYASKPGYTPGENEFGVTTASPVHIAVMLMAGEIPTNPTPTQPGVTPTVTPTVRPTEVASGNNPIDNFRIMFLNMGFDDTYSDWLTGLFIVCIGAALGYGVAKKFGAMCGAPIGLVTATGLGLIPIWALVLIIVIVALAYAKFIMGR